MKDYGNGILASNDLLASIALEQLESERKQRQARAAARQEQQEWFAKWEATRPRGQFGTWNISDRH